EDSVYLCGGRDSRGVGASRLIPATSSWPGYLAKCVRAALRAAEGGWQRPASRLPNGLQLFELVKVGVRMLQIGLVAFGACGYEQVGRRYRHAARPSLPC